MRDSIAAIEAGWFHRVAASATAPSVKRWLPQTMSGWVAVGCVAVAIPLLLALLLADVALSRIAHQAGELADDSLRVAQLATSLRDTLTNLERNTRQYRALRDAELLAIVDDRMAQANGIVGQLLDRQLSTALRNQAVQLQQGLQDVQQRWKQRGPDADGMAERIHAMVRQVDPIIDLAQGGIDEQIGRFRQNTAEIRRLMGLAALTLVPLAGALALVFSRLVMQPLRQLGGDIAVLGQGRYDQPILVNFPHEMQKLGQRIDWLRRRLALLDADKDRFLRHVSHELKTPLASLTEGVALLDDGPLGSLNTAQREVVGILAESTKELEGLIENLLTYAEWRRGYRLQPPDWLAAQALIDDVVAAYRLPLASRELRLEIDVASERLYGQRLQLRAALDNLMTNAIKHAPAGSAIEIRAAVVDRSCELSVRDHGRGVSDEDKQRIFEPFVRGNETEERGVRGTGVGLSIVDEIAHAHGGVALVEDAAPGARFKLLWPCPADYG